MYCLIQFRYLATSVYAVYLSGSHSPNAFCGYGTSPCNSVGFEKPLTIIPLQWEWKSITNWIWSPYKSDRRGVADPVRMKHMTYRFKKTASKLKSCRAFMHFYQNRSLSGNVHPFRLLAFQQERCKGILFYFSLNISSFRRSNCSFSGSSIVSNIQFKYPSVFV